MDRVDTDKAMRKRVLFLVENLPSPFDRRVWQEATTLQAHGYEVSIICPTGRGYEKRYELLEGVHIYRYCLPLQAKGIKGYFIEYPAALFLTFLLTSRVVFTRGVDAIHACNPPDLLFLIAGFYKLLMGKKFVFDHHDINPELYEAKFGRRDFFYSLLVRLERWTFKTADISIATNESYRRIAIERGRMNEDKVYVVRSGPCLEKWRIMPPKPELRHGRKYLVSYIGVMGQQEGIDYLLRAISHLINEMGRADVHFTLIGDGPLLEEMKNLAKALGIGTCTTFTGRISDQDLQDIVNTSDICVNPDVANEMNDKSTMNKIMEYMALGKPIVQFDLSEGRFTARDASLYAMKNDPIDMARRIGALLDNAALRKYMGEFGRQRIENELNWHYESPKLLAAYDALFSTKPRKQESESNVVSRV